jgi:hypothetical protein
LLLGCSEEHGAGHPLWVAFPFDAGASVAQPEALARVVRCTRTTAGIQMPWNMALQFEATAHSYTRRNGSNGLREKKNGAGNKISLPIRVRPQNVPWHEEAMTIEFGGDRLKFLTNREYGIGDQLQVSFVSGTGTPWDGDEEWETKVTGIEMEAGSDEVQVTVRRMPASGALPKANE